MNDEQPVMGDITPSPKEAALNLVKAIRTPLIFFGIGIAATLIYQSRKRSSVS